MFEKNRKTFGDESFGGRGGHGEGMGRSRGFSDGQNGMHARQGRMIGDMTAADPERQVIFVGSVNCLRHKPFTEIGKQMQAGRASILCPSMSDFSSGRYLTQVKDAIVELSEERNSKKFLIVCGCQWVILSTDGDLICKELKDEYGIDAEIFEDDHLEFGDHE